MLSVSAWNHTHGARYQNRTGTYRLEVCRSAINLIRRKEWATITAVTQGGFKEDEEYGKSVKDIQSLTLILAYINGFLRPTFNQVIRNFSQRS